MKMLIDTDTGVDDSIALLYALNHPDVEIVGITTSCGNVDAMQAAQNTLRIIELAGCEYEIPVVVGSNRPLYGEWGGCVSVIHGDNGLGNVTLPDPVLKVKEGVSLEDFIYETACRYEGELVLVTLSRLTNIALTMKKYPDITKKFKRVVMMGGTVYTSGNVSPVSEANFEGDPEACDQVFMSGMNIEVVGLDVTTKARLKKTDVEMMETYCSERCKPMVRYMKEALVHYMRGSRLSSYYLDECPLHDPLAMMVAVVPSLVKTRRMKARIECGGTYCRGQVVTDLREHPFEAKYIDFALEVDQKRAVSELFSVFQ